MLVDSHCHLNFPDFKADFGEVLSRAKNNGVQTLLTISTSLLTFHEVIKAASKNGDIFASVGVHPLHINEDGFVSHEKIISLCKGKKIVGIGETGLDYHYPETNINKQQINFIEHIRAAQKTGLPLIVHTRDADDDTLGILKQQMSIKPFKCLIHCFTASAQFAEECLKLGCYISVSGIISFKNATALQDIVRKIPLDRLLVETDSPYLAPTPFRGKRNEPSYVKHVAEALALLKEVSYSEIATATTDNFYKLFNKVQRP